MTALHEATAYDVPVTRELSAPSLPRQRSAGRSGGAVPAARPTTGSHRRIPAQRGADTGRHRPVRNAPRRPLAAAEPEVLQAELELADEETEKLDVVAPRTRRRLSRRPSVLLGALIAGGLVAGYLSFPGTDDAAQSTSVLAAQTALLSEEELEVMPMASITEAQAQARLDEVAASRKDRADARAAAKAAAIEAARPKTVMPVSGATLTSTFGPRWGTYHYGIDLAAPMRTPEYAAADGVVLRAGAASGFGLAVYILHENGDVTVYGHMDEITVAPGDYVEAGDTIALLGNRGQSTGPHLHFEVHQGGENGTKIDPIPWLRDRGVDI
jgi:murein DD-endopeptidase MepM/ murein hydrolase activator NlpD